MVSGQRFPSETSETKATTGLTVQLSTSSIITLTSGAGAGPIPITIGFGLEAVGGMLSLIVYVHVQTAVAPEQSV